MLIEPMIKNLLEAGVHFGHQTRRWNPKMKRFIFGAKNGIYLVDLQQTAEALEKAVSFLRSVAEQGGAILFVGTKRQAQPIIVEQAARCGQFWVSFRWLGGLLTNFQTVRRSIERLKSIRTWKEDGTMEKITKKEAAGLEKELFRLERVLGGIIEMGRLPKAIVVVDAKREETAIREATRLNIPVVGLVDTNSDPDPIAYVIPGNDDAIRSIQMVLSVLADAILEGRQSYLAGIAAAAEEKEEKEREAARELAAASEKSAAESQPSLEEPGSAAVPLVDEVEAIVPEGALTVKLKEADQMAHKSKLVKPKTGLKPKPFKDA